MSTVSMPPGTLLRPGGLALTRRALAHCCLPVGARVLDVGCGAGQAAAWLREQGLQAYGLDRRAPEGPSGGPPRMVADGRWLPLPAASMDVVLAECSLSVMPAPHQALAECARVLRPGGWLIVNDLYVRSTPGEPMARAADWLSLDLAQCLAELGFERELWEDHTPALRAFAAEWYMAHGTLEPWLDCAGTVEPKRLGYFLAVARRLPIGGKAWTTWNACAN